MGLLLSDSIIADKFNQKFNPQDYPDIMNRSCIFKLEYLDARLKLYRIKLLYLAFVLIVSRPNAENWVAVRTSPGLAEVIS
jgi:hypothetical protein